MENKLHIELLAKAAQLKPETIESGLQSRVNKFPLRYVDALTALQALETALTEKHRAEVEGLKEYIQHLPDCSSRDMTGMIDRCTCGLDQLLTTKTKE